MDLELHFRSWWLRSEFSPSLIWRPCCQWLYLLVTDVVFGEGTDFPLCKMKWLIRKPSPGLRPHLPHSLNHGSESEVYELLWGFGGRGRCWKWTQKSTRMCVSVFSGDSVHSLTRFSKEAVTPKIFFKTTDLSLLTHSPTNLLLLKWNNPRVLCLYRGQVMGWGTYYPSLKDEETEAQKYL